MSYDPVAFRRLVADLAAVRRRVEELETLETPGEMLNLAVGAVLTIAGGVITVTASFHQVETQNGDATDDLDTINGGTEGDILVLRAYDATHTVVVKDSTDNIKMAGDFSLDHTHDTITLIATGTGTWLELSRSDNL